MKSWSNGKLPSLDSRLLKKTGIQLSSNFEHTGYKHIWEISKIWNIYEWTKNRNPKACVNKHALHSMAQNLFMIPFEQNYSYLPLNLQVFNR